MNHKIVQLGIQEKYISVTCRQIIDEFRNHLLFDPRFKEYQLSAQIVDEWINVILSFSTLSTVCKDALSLQPPIPDIKDAPIVAVASCSKTDYMVTWNKHLLYLLKLDSVNFVKPFRFIKILRLLGHFLYQLLIKIGIRLE